jgi:primase-polymerase (primpol)-like protein
MIPEELRNFKQWCCSSGESKIPLNAKTKIAAAVNDPNTWSTYEEAVAAGFPFVGFVLSDQDPYTIIDLDQPETEEQRARHTKILETLDSYAELSKSGTGVHIIVKGTIPKGVRRDKVEIYSTLRYMICTGKKINDKEIAERQELLDVLYREMDTTATIELAEEDSLLSDSDLVDMAMSAGNADKFNMLCSGQWQQDYPSQSEADFALLSIIAYYTRSNEQVRRIFRMSALGKRAKAYRPDYINTALSKIRAQQPDLVDISNLCIASPIINEPEPEPEPEITCGFEIHLFFVCSPGHGGGHYSRAWNDCRNRRARIQHLWNGAQSIYYLDRQNRFGKRGY